MPVKDNLIPARQRGAGIADLAQVMIKSINCHLV